MKNASNRAGSMVSKARADKNRFLFNFMPYPIRLPETKTVQAGKK
jgi:hypothetical protein